MDKVILAQNIELSGGLGTSRPNDNQIVFGGTGTGKSMSIALPTLCHTHESSIIGTFAKRKVVDKLAYYFKRLGYATHVWNLANPGHDDAIPDPLMYVHTDDDVQEYARQIAHSNPEYDRSSHFDPYWRDASIGLMTGLIYYVLETDKRPTTKKVIDCFYNFHITESGRAIETTFDERVADLAKRNPASMAVRKLRSFMQLPYATAGCVRDDLEKCIQTIFPASIQRAMSRSACIDFQKFATELTAVFIITSPVRVAQYSFANVLFAIAISRMIEFAESRQDGHLPRNVKLFFDDFSCGFPVDNFDKTISTFRAAGISSLMLCQSLSQLDATYGQDKSTVILDNCSCMVYMPGGMNTRTCSFVSQMTDMPLEEVMFMELGSLIVCQSGKRPVVAKRYDTLSDPLYQEMMEPGNYSLKK